MISTFAGKLGMSVIPLQQPKDTEVCYKSSSKCRTLNCFLEKNVLLRKPINSNN